jgi:hypothetical protein
VSKQTKRRIRFHPTTKRAAQKQLVTKRDRRKSSNPLLAAIKTKYPKRKKSVPLPMPARPRPTHNHGMRANTIMHHAAAATSAKALIALEGLLTHNHFALYGNAFNPDSGQIAEYQELRNCSEGPFWQASCAKGFGRLLQGHGKHMPTGTETMFFIRRDQIPKHKKPTYMRIVAAYRPKKSTPHCVQFTCGGNIIEYDGDVSTKTAHLTTVRCHINNVLSAPGAKYMTADLSNFYLETPMDDYEYM